MKISPNSLLKLKEEHVKIANQAAIALGGNLGAQARFEHKQAKNSELFYVSQEAADKIIALSHEADELTPPLITPNGWLVFENGTGLKQPCTPFPNPTAFGLGLAKVEVYGVFWYMTPENKAMISPIFKAQDLRDLDPNLVPRQFYSDWVPFIQQHQLRSILGDIPELRIPHNLLKAVCTLMPELGTEEKIVRLGRKNHKRNTKYTYVLAEAPQQEQETEEDTIPTSPAADLNLPMFASVTPDAIPQFLHEGDAQGNYITISIDPDRESRTS